MRLLDRANIPQQVLTRILGNAVVVLDLATGSYFGLDPVGAKIWELLGRGITFGEICVLMSGEYEVSRQELEVDVMELVEELEAQKLITITPG